MYLQGRDFSSHALYLSTYDCAVSLFNLLERITEITITIILLLDADIYICIPYNLGDLLR